MKDWRREDNSVGTGKYFSWGMVEVFMRPRT